MIKSICIVRLSALGDVLMLVPLIRTLQMNLPQAALTWIISYPAYDLVKSIPGIEFIVINKPNNLKDYWQFKKRLKNRFFDVLLATQASFRANLLYPFIHAKRKIGFDTKRAKDGHHWFINEAISPGQEHNVDGFLKFASALKINTLVQSWDLPIAKADEAWALAHLPPERPLLLINAAASKPERSWLLERYVAVIKEAKRRWQAKVVLIGGPLSFDRDLANAIKCQVSCFDLVGKTKPNQLLALIQQADALLCPDTGPAHMAAAVNTPVVALHAVTNSAITGPYTFRHLVVDCYPKATALFLKKGGWGVKVHGKKAMMLIEVNAVLDKLALVLNKFSTAPLGKA